MPKLVISTVGTSLLTNQIDTEFEQSWLARLQDTVNCSQEEIYQYHEDVFSIIGDLNVRCKTKLDSGDIDEIRDTGAELNGLYGLYHNKLEIGIADAHLLISTDTAQAIISAEILESFLKNQGINNISTYISPGLSTTSTIAFSQGMAKLIPEIQTTVLSYRKDKYQIYFNLVGGFKALQGYFNTIGMFYADEIIYVFEGSREVIQIPKLPVIVDKSRVKPYEVQLAMMSAGEINLSWEEAKKIPPEWVLLVDREMTLSPWGQLVWNQCKEDFLTQAKPLKFPNIEYEQSFIDDYRNDHNQRAEEKIKLHETLARASCLLMNHTDGITALKQDGRIHLRRYEGKHKELDHFDLPKGRRVSCLAKNGILYLRHYGEHDYVNNNP
jgi:putative CRISPR-associated protein (TIGR02619 family)